MISSSYDLLVLGEISNRLRTLFQLWGYKEILFPAVAEYDSRIRKGTKFLQHGELYLIAPDATSRIMLKWNEAENLRVYYVGEVLDGDIKGQWQAGIELIGAQDIWLHAEVLSIAIGALEALGVKEFYIDMGSMEVWRRAIKGIEKYAEKVWSALHHRNFQIIEKLPISKEKKLELWNLFNFRGKVSGIEKLDRIAYAVDDERLFIDLGTVRPLPYYIDVIFEIYSPEIGKPIGGGGEYNLQGKKGMGFMLDLGILKRLYEDREIKRIKMRGEDIRETFYQAKKLVKMGIPVEVAP